MTVHCEGCRATLVGDHTTFIYLMDRDGAYATHFATNTAPAKMAEAIEQWAGR